MSERKISAEDVAQILQAPDLAIPQGPKWILAKRIALRNDNQVAAVVLERKDQKLWLVITVLVRFEANREQRE